MARPRALISWSSGKDCAWALHRLREAGELEVVGLLTTVTDPFARVSMHAVPEAILDRQAAALGLACRKARIPHPCSNERYDQEMTQALAAARAEGVTHVAFGDLFLQDIREYRETRLAGSGIAPVFPLWGSDTARLAGEMIEGGLRALVTCVDPRRVSRSLAGADFGPELISALPPGVDPCGENGEFHTFAWAGPMFEHPLAVRAGEIVERDGFVFADVVSA